MRKSSQSSRSSFVARQRFFGFVGSGGPRPSMMFARRSSSSSPLSKGIARPLSQQLEFFEVHGFALPPRLDVGPSRLARLLRFGVVGHAFFRLALHEFAPTRYVHHELFLPNPGCTEPSVGDHFAAEC